MVDFDELRRLYEAGSEAALHGAASACRPDHGVDWVTVPAWVFEALFWHNIAYMRELAPGKGKGRTAKWGQQYYQDFVHLIRFSEVNRARQQGLTYSEAYKHVAEDLKVRPTARSVRTEFARATSSSRRHMQTRKNSAVASSSAIRAGCPASKRMEKTRTFVSNDSAVLWLYIDGPQQSLTRPDYRCSCCHRKNLRDANASALLRCLSKRLPATSA